MIKFGVNVREDLAMNADGTLDAHRFAEAVVTAERLGYDYVCVAHHVFVPPYLVNLIGGIYLEPFTVLAYLAARTSRIELVLTCLVVPYRQPFETAQAVATLDQLSGGRFALGVVPGYLKEEFETFRIPFDQRGEMTNEFVRIMIEVWTSESATFNGKFYSCDGIDVKPKCARRPHVPIWIGGSSRRALERVVAFGDVWHPLGMTVVDGAYKAAHADEFAGKALPTDGTTPVKLRESLAYLDGIAEKAGRDLNGLEVVLLAGLPADEDETSVREKMLSLTEGGERTIDWLGRYIEAGATGFFIVPPGDSLEEGSEHLQRFAEEVIPQLRGRSATTDAVATKIRPQ